MRKVFMVYSIEEELHGCYDEHTELIGVFGSETDAKNAVEKEVNKALSGKKSFIDFWQRQGREAYVSLSETPAGAPYIEYEVGISSATEFITEDRSSLRWAIEAHDVIGS